MFVKISDSVNRLEFLFGVIGTFIAATIFISLFSMHEYENENSMYAQMGEQLSTLNKLKKHKLDLFFNYRISDIEMLSQAYEPKKEGIWNFYLKTHGCDDIFILSAKDATFLYSLKHPGLVGKSFTKTIRNHEALYHLYQKTLQTKETQISDMQLSIFNINKAFVYLSTPLMLQDNTQGVLFISVNSDAINSILAYTPKIVQSYETYAVGEDFLLRSDSSLEKNFSVISSLNNPLRKIKNGNVEAALNAKSGFGMITDYRGISVLSAYDPFIKGEIKWALLSEVEQSYITQKLDDIQASFYTLGMGVVIIVFLVSFWMVRLVIQRKVIIPFTRLYKKSKGFEEIIENSLNEIYICKKESFEFVYANKKALENLGYTLGELQMMKAYDLSPRMTAENFERIIEPLLQNKVKVYVFETAHRRKNGTTYDVEVNLELIEVEGEEKFVAIINDITIRKKALADKEYYYGVATHDYLTKIYNRQKFDEYIKEEYERIERYGGEASLILFDIDHFKNINDSYGHDVGDSVLIELTELVEQHLRKSDKFARWGGEEFVILMVETDLNSALVKARQLRLSIEKYSFKTVENVTCSFGVAHTDGDKDVLTLFKEVDDALYEAKKTRNSVVSMKA